MANFVTIGEWFPQRDQVVIYNVFFPCEKNDAKFHVKIPSLLFFDHLGKNVGAMWKKTHASNSRRQGEFYSGFFKGHGLFFFRSYYADQWNVCSPEAEAVFDPNHAYTEYKQKKKVNPHATQQGYKPEWAEILGVNPDVDADTLKSIWRHLAKVSHPDHGGNVNDFLRYREAYEQGLRYFGIN